MANVQGGTGSAELRRIADAVAAEHNDEIRALAGRLATLPEIAGLSDVDQVELRHALGAELAAAGASQQAATQHAEALRRLMAGSPDPRDVLVEIDALVTLAEAGGDLVTAARLQAIAVELTRTSDGEDSAALHARLDYLARLRIRSGDPAGGAAAAAEAAALRETRTPPPAAPPLAPALPSAQPAARSSPAAVPLPDLGGSGPTAAGWALESVGGSGRARSVRRDAAPPASSVTPPEPAAGSKLVPVHFVTSRVPTGNDNPYLAFSGRRHGDAKPIHSYGVAEVSVPTRRKVGTLRTAGWLQRHAGFESDELYLMKRVSVASNVDAWTALLRDRLAASTGGEALVFVHGFNVEFWEAMVRAAQLYADLDIDGVVAAYSWPSRGNVLGYAADRQQIIAPHIDELKALIGRVATSTGVKQITVIAHSMGCEFMLPALVQLQLELAAVPGRTAPLIKDVIFAAPDVDVAHFAGLVPKLKPLAERVSVYCSQVDSALNWGRILLMSHDRAGAQASKLAELIQGSADTIDTSEASADMLGHSDFASSAMDDLRAVVWLSLMPEQRPTLVKAPGGTGSAFWVYRGIKAGPKAEAFREALLLARRHGGIGGAMSEVERLLKDMANKPAAEAGQGVGVRYSAVAQALMAMA